ncbi:MAG: TetR/AcrR family transcriptional regulator [Gammaproteobacteria bacterium]|nr:TetR/AcrR family transcriptional regulator [Gammaproteobacteria bacterium]
MVRSQKKRAYSSQTRAKQAVKTRACILQAAQRLFQKKGFEGVKIEEIAQAAKVATSTVYALFKSKRGLLHVLMDQAMSAGRHEELVNEAMQTNCAKKRLAIAAKIAREMYEAEQSQIDLYRGAALLAPEFKAIEAANEARRYQRLQETICCMVKEESLIKGMKQSQAHDILWAFTGRDMYRLFVMEREWAPNVYEKWLTNLLVKLLLANE